MYNQKEKFFFYTYVEDKRSEILNGCEVVIVVTVQFCSKNHVN